MLIVAACGKEEGTGEKTITTRAYLNCNSVVKGYATSCQLRLEAPVGTQYTVSVESDNDWCTLTNGNVTEFAGEMITSDAGQWVYFTRNESKEIRYATISVSFDNGYNFDLSLRQTVIEAPESYDKPWNELPKYVPNDDYVYLTHSATLNGEQRRNYTFCFDKTKHASLWVAYPQHRCYTSGSANRNNSDFGYDPEVETSWQAFLVGRSYVGRYDRGHQIPAADRKCSQEMMDQTFYATNMTPQQSNFNQKRWGYLEGKVRNWVCSDTLYVVTGAYFGGPYSSSIATSTGDGAGNSMPTPSHYFKVVLRTVNGNTQRSVDSFDDASQLQAIGIWLQHENSGEDISLPTGSVVPVKYIEQQTGFEFFNMLNPAIADAVKSQCEPRRWSGLQ